jgi:hypothetical protein
MDKDQNINLKIENKDLAQFTGMARVQEFVRTVMSVLGMIISVLIFGVIIASAGFLGWSLYEDNQSAQNAKPQQSKFQPAKIQQSKPAKPAADLTSWRQIKKDMSMSDVRTLLGEPNRIQGGSFSTWDYPKYGSVTFYKDVVFSWTEPQ